MITPIGPPVPVSGPFPVSPAAPRAAGTATAVPVVEADRAGIAGAGPAADARRVPPAPGAPAIRPRPRDDEAGIAGGRRIPPAEGPDGTAPGTGRNRRFGASSFEEIRSERPRARPSSTFLAQAIGQELAAGDGSAAAPRPPGSVAALYRRTDEAVARARFSGLVPPP